MSGGIAAVTSLALEARVAAGAGVFVVCGQGERLAAALESAVARGACGIISFGVAGGLAPGQAPGDWVVATGVIAGRQFFPTDPAWSRSLRERLPNAAHADILGMDEVAADPERKQLLYAQTGAVAIDMESHIAAKVAAASRIPFAASRVIIDPAERALPPAALVGLRSDGTPDVEAVFRSVLQQPRQLPALLRIALDAKIAGAALRRGRRTLGAGLGFPSFGGGRRAAADKEWNSPVHGLRSAFPVERSRIMGLRGAANQRWRDRSIDGSEPDSSTRHKEKVVRLPATPALLSASLDTGEPRSESKEAPCIGGNLQPAIWFEAEDFLRYFDHFRNPTGTQRLSFEIYSAANLLYGASERVKFCRLSLFTKRLHAIRFEDLRSAFLNPLGATAPWKTFWEPAIFWERFPRSIPVALQHPRFFLSLFKFAARDLLGTLTGRTSFDRQLRRGDMIVSLGAGWGIPGYMKHMAETKQRYGIKFSIFVHDVLPMEFPSFFEPRHANHFAHWLREAIPLADIVLTNSKYTRARLIELTAKSGWRLPRIEVLEPGSGFSDRLPARGQAMASLPARYVLFVSTIEIRKNHRLLVRVWERLVKRHGADRVPALVFVGMIGWSFDELLADLAASDYLNGKIVILRSLSDAKLHEAYRRCLFTVFPSFCEGWGLPIAESLAHGKFSIVSNRTSIPEVGGNLVDYFDPADEEDALAKIERPLLDPAYLATREAQVRAEYRRRTWNDCVHALMGAFARSSRDRTPDRTADAERHAGVRSADDVSCA